MVQSRGDRELLADLTRRLQALEAERAKVAREARGGFDSRIPLLATEFDVEGAVFPPAFRVTKNDAQVIATATWTKIEFDDEDYDTHSAYDAVTDYRFIAPMKGTYSFLATMTIAMTDAAKVVIAGLFLNSVETSHGTRQFTHGTASYGVFVGDTYSLDLGDTVDAAIYHDSGGNRSTTAFATANHFSGHLVSV